MKKTAILVAGLLLVSGTTFAEGALDFTGTEIKAKTNLVDTATNPINDDSNGDTDMILKLKYNIDPKTTATFEYNTDDNYDFYDNEAELILNRKDGKVEAQFDAAVILGANSENGEAFLMEDPTSDKTFIKYNHTKDLAFTFYPFNMGLNNGKVFEHSDYHTDIPGVVLGYKNIYAGIGMDAIEGTDESVVALKTGATYKSAKAEFSAKYSGAFWDEDELTPGLSNAADYVATAGTLGYVAHDINFNLNYKATKKFTLDTELGVNVLSDDMYVANPENGETDDVSTGFGLSLKGTYAATAKTGVYGQFKYTTDGFFSYEDMADWNLKTGIDLDGDDVADANQETAGVFELIAGVDYKLTEKLVLNGEAKLQAAGNEIFADKDGDAQSSHFVLSTSASYKF